MSDKLCETLNARSSGWRALAKAYRTDSMDSNALVEAIILERCADELEATTAALAGAASVGAGVQDEALQFIREMVAYDHARHCRGKEHVATCINGRAILERAGALGATSKEAGK